MRHSVGHLTLEIKQDSLRQSKSSRVMIFSSFSSEGRGIPGGLPSKLEKSLLGEERNMLTSSVMYDFLPKWLDIQDSKNFFEFPKSVLLDIHYENKSKN